MRIRPLVAAAVVVTLAGCSPQPQTDPVTPSPTPTATAPSQTASPLPSPIPSPTPSPDAHLPDHFLVVGPLIDDVPRVVRELERVSGNLPAVKLDISTSQVTLTVLTPEDTVRSYRWRDDQIAAVDSDVQYVGQATFDPLDFPLGSVRRILDVAALVSNSSSNQVLQIVEYRAGSVYMSVTTRPETKTLFFEQDGTILTELGFESVADIAAGLASVTEDTQEVIAAGFSPDQGYWAEVALPGGIIERRTRMGAVPMFTVQHSASTGLEPFDVELLDAAAIGRALALFREPGEKCAVVIDGRFGRVQPVVQYTCPGSVNYSDMQGRDMTAELT